MIFRMYPVFSVIVIAVAWVSPFAIGPTPVVIPWLVSAATAVGLWLAFSEISAKNLAHGWLLAALVSVGIGLLQYFGAAEGVSTWISNASAGQAFGNLRQRNHFASLTSIGLISLLWFVQSWRTGDGYRKIALSSPTTVGMLWLLGAVFLAVGNAISGSRTGMFQWCLVIAMLTMWRSHLHWRTLAVGFVAVAAYALAIVAMPWLLHEISGVQATGLLTRFDENAGCASRRVLWSNVIYLISQKPWLGWGWGELDFAHFMTLYPGERFCDLLDNAHNLPLHLAVELGLPVAVLCCALGGWVVWRQRPWREADPSRQMAWGVLAVILLHSMVEYPMWYGPFQVAVGLSIWLLWRPPHREQKLTIYSRFSHIGQAMLAMLLIALLAMAAWDYWRVSQLYLPPAERWASLREDTLMKVHSSWLFQDPIDFAELSTTPIESDNAERLNTMAKQLLHFSPEARVVEKVIESATLLGKHDESQYYLQRFKAAYPDAYALWVTKTELQNSDKTP